MRRQYGSISFWSWTCQIQRFGSGSPHSSAIRLALCFQVLYYGKYILSVWNNQGNKKLAPAVGKRSSNYLIDTCKMLTYCSLLFLCCRSKGYVRVHACAALWQSPTASVPLRTLHWAAHFWVIENNVSCVIQSSLFPHFSSSQPSVCCTYTSYELELQWTSASFC